ncbi:MAG: PQQ-binding-like beta-propeller repeat protein, partial [Deltaproteobacteria bacterium]|nr:PQQ-binding-like beta-propeller repeat protein [Deltaproteobacteria bacterium]
MGRVSPAHVFALLVAAGCLDGGVARVELAEEPGGAALVPAGLWPSWLGGASHAGAGTVLGAVDGQVRWSATLGSTFGGSPAVAADGTVYVQDNARVQSFTANGSLRWRFALAGAPAVAVPVVGDDGAVYAAGAEIVRLTSSGTASWRVTPSCTVNQPPAAAGRFLVVPQQCGLAAYNPADGSVAWTYSDGPSMDPTSAAVGADGTAYFVTGALAARPGILHAVSSTGTGRWRADLGPEGSPAPLVTADGRIAVVGGDGSFQLFESTGTLAMQVPLGSTACAGRGSVAGGLAQALDGTFRVPVCDAAGGGVLVALDANGSELWRVSIGNVEAPAPAVAADGTTYLANLAGTVAALAVDGSRSWQVSLGAVRGGVALGLGGTVLVVDTAGRLNALGSACVPQCWGRDCGPNGCGGSCGACSLPPQCATGPGLCDTAMGTCAYPSAVEGSSCSDGDGCTAGDACRGGQCTGAALLCDDWIPCTSDACTPDLSRMVSSTNVPFLDISTSGTPSVSGDDVLSTPVPLGFTLDLFGTPVTAVALSTNGFVTTGISDAFDNAALPSAAAPNGLLAPFWDDLNVPPGALRYQRVGRAPNRRFIVQWTAVQWMTRFGPNFLSSLTFQLIVSEGNNVEFRYLRLAPQTRPRARGNSATVGIESPSGTQAAQFSFNTAALRDGMGVAWDRTAGACTNLPVPDGAGCDDGDPCTTPDRCLGGNCSGAPMLCTATGACVQGAFCDPATGACATLPAPDGTSCSTGNRCETDVCRAGSCVPVSTLTCTPPDACNNAQCDPTTGSCVTTPERVGTVCDDGNRCTTRDTCDGLGRCLAGAPLTCPPAPVCNASACDPSTGGCVTTPQTAGTACDDGNRCTTRDACDGLGRCAAGAPLVCPPAPVCNASACDPATGGCVASPQTAGTACDDGNRCTMRDVCDGLGRCAAGAPLVCPPAPVCNTSACNSTTGACLIAPMADGTPCPGGTCRFGACMIPPDAGVPPVDAGPRFDAGSRDAAIPFDAGPRFDAGSRDAAIPFDAGPRFDAGSRDAAIPFDAGPRFDAGSRDAAVPFDAGPRFDAGSRDAAIPFDAGPRFDAGSRDAAVPFDAGPRFDAGSRDAAVPFDAGPRFDAGSRDAAVPFDAGPRFDA